MSARCQVPDNKIRPLRWLVLITIILIVIGGLNIYSSTSYMNLDAGVSAYRHIGMHLLYLVVGIFVAVIVSRCPISFVRNGAFFWVVGVVIFLLLVMVAGTTVHGARRWLMLGPLSMQPSEFAKVVAVIWAASKLASRVDKNEKITIFPRLIRPFLRHGSKKRSDSFGAMISYFSPLIAPLIMALLVLRQPDMGTAGLILLFPVLFYILAGLPVSEILFGLVVATIAFFALVILEPYRWDRVIVLWDPFSYYENLGYQTVQSLIAVGSGGLFGQGIGEGMAKFLYLPEQYTDFAYAIWSQEFGFVGSAAVLALYLGFLFCGFSVARKMDRTYEALLIYGLTMLVSVEGILNIAMVIGCFPVTGVPLPFISYGGTSLLTNILIVGLIWGTAMQAFRRQEKEKMVQKEKEWLSRGPVSLDAVASATFRPSRYR